MKHYKDDCHHYKVIDKHRVITVLNLGTLNTRIEMENYASMKHYVVEAIENKKLTKCTEAEYQTAFDKALKTIKNLK